MVLSLVFLSYAAKKAPKNIFQTTRTEKTPDLTQREFFNDVLGEKDKAIKPKHRQKCESIPSLLGDIQDDNRHLGSSAAIAQKKGQSSKVRASQPPTVIITTIDS